VEEIAEHTTEVGSCGLKCKSHMESRNSWHC